MAPSKAPEAAVKNEPTSNEPEASKANQKKKQEEELSEEDQRLKDDLELLVERLNEPNQSIDLYNEYLNTLKTHIKESTTSMTAVPKPLKFLRPHYPLISELYDNW
ncbi:hypothetical protein QCA50_021189, partial [Cerrena zonata]